MYRIEFLKYQYSANRLSQLDSAWYVMYTVMTVVGKRVLVTENEQRIFDVAIVTALVLLLTKLCLPRLYADWRATIVFSFHAILTTLRAMAVFSMAPRQAVHWRPFRHATEVGMQDTLMFYLSTMLGTTGGSHRLLEMLGLQQPVRSNAIITCYYIVIQLFAGMHGFRMGYANGLFFLAQEGFDGLHALLDTLLDWLVLLPTRQQATCNSCPGVSLYATVLLWSGAVMPLYVAFVLEQAAYKRYKRTRIAAQAAQQQQALGNLGSTAQQAPADAPIGNALQPEQQWNDDAAAPPAAALVHFTLQQQQQQLGEAQHWWHRLASPRILNSSYSDALPPHLQLPPHLADALEQDAQQGSVLIRWMVHLLALVALLLLCWCVAVLGTELLLRQLTREQLEYLCPPGPRVPFLIAGQVYDG